MGHQLSKPGRESSTSHTAKLSQEDIAKILSASPFQPEDYMIKDVDDQKNQVHEDSQQMTEEQIEYVKKCVGRIIAKYPKKLRRTLKGLQSTKEIITNGTASFIDNNLLITAAHNIFLREYNQMASEVYFLPEMLNNSQSGAVDLIPAQQYAVFEEYSNPQNEYTQKFDIALVVLQDHKFSSQTACLDIEWSYKRWEHLSPSLHLFGYPENLKNKKTKINEMKYENKFISQQDEMVCYSNTCGGESGGPLIKLSSSEKESKVKLVGVHKGVRGNNSVGLTLNSSENTQEIIYQLAEKLQVEGRMKAYEFSCKKMREFMKKEKNVMEKLKQLSKLQEENSRQKEEIKRLNSTIDQLKDQINTLNESIQKMKAEYFEKGKQSKLQQTLIQKLGIYEGKKLFTKYSTQLYEIKSIPLAGSKKLKILNQLTIYKYPQNIISLHEKNSAKTLIVLGQTGCGKSTFLNSLANYLAGVQLEDSFRYFVVVQDTSSQIASITSDIHIYYIKNVRNNACYRVIDTPGFGDTNGLNKDYETVKKIEQLFKQIDQIHLVLFLLKSSNTRVTAFQYYIFQNVMDLFDKSIAQNFIFVLTFADGSKPVVLQSITNNKTGFGNYWDNIKQPKMIEVNNSSFFQKYNHQSKITAQFWRIGCLFLSKLVAKAQRIQSKSLRLTQTLIIKKNNLSTWIKATAQKIQNHIASQQNIREQLLKILGHEQEMKKNQNYQYEFDVIQSYAEKVSYNVTRCNNCLQNCHIDCWQGDRELKKNCIAMDSSGNCTVCSGKCSYVVHTNDNVIRKQRTVKKRQTKQLLKRKYHDAKNQISCIQNSVKSMIQDYQAQIKQTQKYIEHMTKLQQQLANLSMSKSKPLSTKQYILFLIENEKRDKRTGYIKRIQSYNTTLNQIEFEQKIVKGQYLKQVREQRNKQLFENLQKDKRAKSSNVFKKIKKFFEQIS